MIEINDMEDLLLSLKVSKQKKQPVTNLEDVIRSLNEER